MSPVHLAHPLASGARFKLLAQLLHRRGNGPRRVGPLRRGQDRREQRGCGQVGDRKGIADQVAGGLQLGLEAVHGGDDLGPGLGRTLLVDVVVCSHHSRGGGRGDISVWPLLAAGTTRDGSEVAWKSVQTNDKSLSPSTTPSGAAGSPPSSLRYRGRTTRRRRGAGYLGPSSRAASPSGFDLKR